MRLVLLAVITFSAVLAVPENCDESGYELIIRALEDLQNNAASMEHNLKSIGTKVEQLSTQLVDHTKIVTEKIDQLVDVTIGGERGCPQNANDGVYRLQPEYSSIPPFLVYCENGWIVIHRRFNGSLDFNLGWVPYQEGFGDLQSEYWLGLEKMHQTTRMGTYELMVVLKNFDGLEKTATYEGFKIGSEFEQYRMQLAWFSGGDAGDSLMYHNAMKFSTPDRNNDETEPSQMPCAQYQESGWWFRACRYANLNGIYQGEVDNTMSWFSFNENHDSLKEARMMIRRKP